MASGRAGAPPDFVAVGHLTVDELSSGLRPGGSALYAGLYQDVPLGALTFVDKGAVLFVNGERHAVPAAPARERARREGLIRTGTEPTSPGLLEADGVTG